MKKFVYVIYALLFLAVTGLLIYEIFIAKNFETRNIGRYIILVVGMVASVIKFSVQPQRKFLSKKKAYQNAYSDFIRSAFSQDPKLENQLYRAIDDYNQNKCSAAIRKLEALRKQCQNSDDIYAVSVFSALCYDDLQLFEMAAKQYTAALNLRPHSTLASNLGLCRERLGDQQGAIESYRLANQLDPKNAFPLNNMAQIYVRMGEYEKAIDYATQATALNSKMYQPLNALAISHALMGNTAEYERFYRQAVSCGADGKKLKAYIEAMDASL